MTGINRLAIVGLATLATFAGVLAAETPPATSDTKPLQARRAYAEAHEPLVLNAALERFSIEDSVEKIKGFLLAEHPAAVSSETFSTLRGMTRVRLEALEAVLAGADPDETFKEMDLESNGLSKEGWELDMKNLSPEYVEDFRMTADAEYDDFLEQVATAENIRNAYLDHALSEAICSQPHVRSELDSYFERLFAGTDRSPASGEVGFQCLRLARDWYKDFAASLFVTDLDAPEGWVEELERFHAIRLMDRRQAEAGDRQQ